MIPTLAESIQIELTTGASAGRVTDTQIVARPPNGGVSTVTFENVTPGPASVIATAFPAPAAQGVAQATGRLDFELLEGETHQATVTMASTVATWVAGPAPAPLPVGRTVDPRSKPRRPAARRSGAPPHGRSPRAPASFT